MANIEQTPSIISRAGSFINRLANPGRFMVFSGKVLPWLTVLTVLLFAYGLFLVFFRTPPDYQQGETVKIMFIHVPSAWLAMMGYTIIAIASIGSLVWRHPLADVAVKAALPIGATFTFLALVTGSLWGKPMWGTFWVWDARLTSVLVLFFFYIGLMALQQAFDDSSKAGRASAILALVGFVNIPIIKFSVDWWSTLHQPASVLRAGGSTLHPQFLIPLLVMAVAFTCLFVVLHFHSMRNEILRRRVQSLRLAQIRQSSINQQTGDPHHV